MQAVEDQNRALDEEVSELRELRDREGMSADVRELEHELKVCSSSSSSSGAYSGTNRHQRQYMCNVMAMAEDTYPRAMVLHCSTVACRALHHSMVAVPCGRP